MKNYHHGKPCHKFFVSRFVADYYHCDIFRCSSAQKSCNYQYFFGDSVPRQKLCCKLIIYGNYYRGNGNYNEVFRHYSSTFTMQSPLPAYTERILSLYFQPLVEYTFLGSEGRYMRVGAFIVLEPRYESVKSFSFLS